ncbi:MAG TPA: rhomboid family intramembrane serine protease [Candidatus Saccharimonadia bacterium]|nr:rhomboid family intramembrane serine protease [Candidatus Saccharimonadia bacterium]
MALHDRDYMRGRQSFRWKDLLLPDAVTALIILNAAAFVLQHLFKVATDGPGHPWGVFSLAALLDGRVWTLFTHLFVHQNLLHLVGNCLVIFFAGKAVQALLGPKHFLYIYFLSGVVGAAAEVVAGLGLGQPHSVMGASAAAYGTFLALAAMLPQESVSAMLHFVLPARLRFWTVAVFAMGVSAILALLQIFKVWPTDVSHFAHLGGAMAGWWFVRLLGYGGPPVTYERMWHERQRTEEARAFAGVPRRKRSARVEEEPASPPPLVSTREFIAQEIDPLLDKIAEHGIESLSGEERSLLDRAREEIMRRDQKGGPQRR